MSRSLSRLTGLRTLLLNPRRWPFWAVVVLLVYTLTGFFGVPALVRKLAIDTVQQDLGRQLTIERVRFNPYVLSLEINGLALNDRDGTRLAGWERLYVNFQLSSLFRWAWTFREITLDDSYLLYERFDTDDSRLGRLLADLPKPTDEAPPTEADSPPRFLVRNLAINGGSAELIDHAPGETVRLAAGPVDIAIQELNTLPDRDGRQSVEIRLPGGATLAWQGNIGLAPLQSSGHFEIVNAHLDPSLAYLKTLLPLEAMAATLSLQLDYDLAAAPGGGLGIGLDNLALELTDISVTGLEPAARFISIPAIHADGGTLRYPESELRFASVRISDPVLQTWLGEDGKLNLQQLVPAPAEAATEPPSGDMADSSAWLVAVDSLRLDQAQIDFSDRSIEPNAAVTITQVDLALANVSNGAGAEFPVTLSARLDTGGELGFDGRLTALPEFSLSGSARVSDLALTPAQPYVQQQLAVLIRNGLLDATTDLVLDPAGAVTASGSLAVRSLEVDDTIENLPLAGWDQLTVDRFEADTAASALTLSTVTMDQGFGRLVIREDLTTNLSGLRKEVPEVPVAETEGGMPWTVVVGRIAVNGSGLDFADRSLPLPFATQIRQLDGFISTMDTGSSEPSRIMLEGQVDRYGLARIEGTMNALDPVRHTDVSVEFRNLLMSSLTPYSVEFAGREIDEGKLNLDLLYRIDNGRLDGQNNIVLSDLVLGDKVDNPDAADLPLGLAVALLTDANGVIDIDLPVSGDLNDPEFKIGGVVWKAFVGLITKVVTAPFRLLGSLIGVESEDFGQFRFLAGRHDLTPPELERVAQLQQALQQRPELSIEVGGTYDAAVDGAALRYQRLRAAVSERLGQQAMADSEMDMLNEEIRAALEALFRERFPDTPLDSVRAAHTASPAADPEARPVLDSLAYTADLRDRLLAAEEVSTQELEDLAQARAEVVQQAFLGDGEFDTARITITPPGQVESEDGEWVVMELGVATD